MNIPLKISDFYVNETFRQHGGIDFVMGQKFTLNCGETNEDSFFYRRVDELRLNKREYMTRNEQ